MLEFLMMGRVKIVSSNPFALFGSGHDGVSYVKSTEKYDYSTNTTQVGSSLATARMYLAGGGNYSVGLFAGGYPWSAVADKYIYASDAVGTGGSLGNWDDLCAASTATLCLFAADGITKRYMYAGDAVSAGSALGNASTNRAGTGNSNFALFAGGGGAGYTTYTDQYVYSGAAVAPAASLGMARGYLAAAGTPELGVFCGGSGNSGVVTYTDKYTYASLTRTVGTSLISTTMMRHAGTGNAVVGVFSGGSPVTKTVNLYHYAAASVSAGTSLSEKRQGHAAASSTPGGF